MYGEVNTHLTEPHEHLAHARVDVPIHAAEVVTGGVRLVIRELRRGAPANARMLPRDAMREGAARAQHELVQPPQKRLVEKPGSGVLTALRAVGRCIRWMWDGVVAIIALCVNTLCDLFIVFASPALISRCRGA